MTSPDASVRPPLRFDTLILHRGLRRAMKSSVAIARKRASAPSAVIITGPSGSGKTHLLQAIANERRRHDPTSRVLATTGRDLTIEMVEAYRDHTIAELRREIARLDLLLIDDLDDLERLPRTQEELAHLISDANGAVVAIVCTSSMAVTRLPHIERTWRMICGSETIALHPPDAAASERILRRHLQNENLFLPDAEVARAALENRGTVARLMAAGKRLRFQHEASVTRSRELR